MKDRRRNRNWTRASLEEIIARRFGIHRGIESPYAKSNSLKAIRAAVALEPPFVEFDVMSSDSGIKTGHPPQESLDDLEDVLLLFEGKATYPKVDIKLRSSEPAYPTIKKVVGLAKRFNIHFALVNISADIAGSGAREFIMHAQNRFAEIVRGNPKLRLSIDLARYRDPRTKVDEEIREHVRRLGNIVNSIASEIHEDDMEDVAEFAEEFAIGNITFWLRSWPDVSHPKVAEETIRRALQLEEKYPLKVFFDINHTSVKDARHPKRIT